MPRRCGCCNVVLADGSVRALRPDGGIALTEMAQALRRAGPRARAFALGAQGASLQAVLTALRAQGVWLGAPSMQPGGGPTPALLVVADTAPMQPPGPGLLFLAAPTGTPVPLLLPAVQCAREAARRLMPRSDFEAVLVQHTPAGRGSAAGPSEQLALNFEHIHPV